MSATADEGRDQVAPVFDYRFFCLLDRNGAAQAARTALHEAHADDGPVLVVEDDADIRRLICLALEDEGLPVESAADGREALSRLDAERPALVLLDMSLPEVSGEGVAAGIHRRYDNHVPIVVVSAHATGEQARRLGATAYVAKPFDVNELMDTVHRLLAPAGA
jgi:CheY-like chemotaxis protein